MKTIVFSNEMVDSYIEGAIEPDKSIDMGDVILYDKDFAKMNKINFIHRTCKNNSGVNVIVDLFDLYTNCKGKLDPMEVIRSTEIKEIIKLGEELNYKIILISSSTVYGETKTKAEEDFSLQPSTFQGLISRIAEDMLISASCRYVVLRPTPRYGINKVSQIPYPDFYTKLLDNKKQHLILPRGFITNPVYIGDIFNAAIKLVDKQGIYNLGGPESISSIELALMFIEKFDSCLRVIPITTADMVVADIDFDQLKTNIVSSEKLFQAVKLPKRTTIEDGIDLIYCARSKNEENEI